jgi:hypothetical protein
MCGSTAPRRNDYRAAVVSNPAALLRRKLATSAIGECRVHHETAARAERPALLRDDPIQPPKGKTIATLKDARDGVNPLTLPMWFNSLSENHSWPSRQSF